MSRPARGWVAPLAFTLALALAAAPPARAARDLRVEDAVRMARSRNPAVEAQRATAAAASARIAQAAAGFLPFLTGSFAFEPQSANLVLTPTLRQVTSRGNDTVIDTSGQPVAVVCSTPGQAGCAPTPAQPSSLALQSFFAASVGVAWTPWDWGRSAYAYRAARDVAQSAETGVTTAQRDVALAARLAFFRAVAAGEQVTVADESVVTYARQLDQTRAFHDAGLRTGIDVATAESGLAAAQLTLARARAGLDTARAALAVALGEERWGDWRLVADPAAFDVQPADRARAGTAEAALADMALRRRTELGELDLLARSYADQARSQRGQYLPQLTLAVTPTWAGEDVSALTSNVVFSVSLGYSAGGMTRS